MLTFVPRFSRKLVCSFSAWRPLGDVDTSKCCGLQCNITGHNAGQIKPASDVLSRKTEAAEIYCETLLRKKYRKITVFVSNSRPGYGKQELGDCFLCV